MLQPSTIETRTSWIVAIVCLCIMALSYGGPWIVVVGLKGIAADTGGARSVPSLAGALAWVGAAFGGILMGRVAERVGVRWTVLVGALSIAFGLALSTGGQNWQLYLGHGLFMGLLGNGGINAPFYVYVSRWFDRRRGSALALISSGSYIAGAMWPPVFERSIAFFGWRQTMVYYGILSAIVIVPLALLFLQRPPESIAAEHVARPSGGRERVLGWPPNLVFVMLCAGAFTCCVPMSMPQGHLVAFCGDLGISATHGAAMVSVLLGAAFISRQIWGAISDRIGGLMTLVLGSASQGVAMTAFLITQDEVGLFAAAAAFGLGFGGLIPAYALALRQLFAASEAYWRIPTLLLCSGTGMAAGGWLAGVLYDYFGYYAPAFATGIGVNILNFAILATLAARRHYTLAPA